MVINIIQSLVTKGGVAVINFFVLLVSSRYLGVSSRGEISIFLLNLSVIQVINEIYTGYGIIHFITKFSLRGIILSGLVYTFIFCSLSNIFIVHIQKQVQGFEWLGYLISLCVIINTFNCALLLGHGRLRTYNFLCLIQPSLLIAGLLFFFFVLHVYTFQAYVYPLFFSFIVALAFSSFLLITLQKSTKRSLPFKPGPIMYNGLFLQGGFLMFMFCNRFSFYLLTGSEKVGLYASACVLMESVLVIANGISPVILARATKPSDQLQNAFVSLGLSKLSFLVSLLLVTCILIVPESFIVLVLGNGFVGIKGTMALYAPAVLMVSLFAPLINHFIVTGKKQIVLLCYSIGFIATLVAAPFLINKYDVRGAALNACFSYSLIAVSVCFSFVTSNDLSFRNIFSLKNDLSLFRSAAIKESI